MCVLAVSYDAVVLEPLVDCGISTQVTLLHCDQQIDQPAELDEAGAVDRGSTAWHSSDGAGGGTAAHQEFPELWRPPQSVQVHGAAGG